MPHRPGRQALARRTFRLTVAVASLAIAASGCVERRYVVRTVDPSGRPVNALVDINGEEVGISPVSVNYEYYGDRRVTIQAEGFQTIRTVMPLRAPWWDNVVTGFFSENVVPYTLRDERAFTYQLAPAVSPPPGDLVGRGQALRRQAQVPPPPRPPRFLRFFAF